MGGKGMFAKAFAGGFIGKLAAALFIAICVILGIGPDKWASFIVTGLPIWVTPGRAQVVFLALALGTFIPLVWPLLKGLVKHRCDIIKVDFSDEKQSIVDSKMTILSPEVKHALYRVTTGEIEVHQLNDSMRSALEEVGFVNPAFAYTPAKFNEQPRPFIERWFKRNPL